LHAYRSIPITGFNNNWEIKIGYLCESFGEEPCFDKRETLALAELFQFKFVTGDLGACLIRDYDLAIDGFEACEGKKLSLYDPDYVMDLLHVKDAAASILQSLFVDKIRGIPINIGSGRNLTLAELARIITQSAIKQKVWTPTIEWDNRFNPHPRRYAMDIRCAQSIISWQPKVTIESALEELIRVANDMVKAPGTIHSHIYHAEN